MGPSQPRKPHNVMFPNFCLVFIHFHPQPASCFTARLLGLFHFVRHLQNIYSFPPFREFKHELCPLWPFTTPGLRGAGKEKHLHKT